MATIGTNITLSDFARSLDPNGQVAKIVEQLNLDNPILDDMVIREGNEATGHTTVVRNGLPGVTWRKLNYGVAPSKGLTTQVKDTMGMLESYIEVDKDLASLNNNSDQFLMSQAAAHMEANSQEMATTMFYGTEADGNKFVGLASRMAIHDSGDPAVTAKTDSPYNVLAAGGSGSDNTSVYLVGWGDMATYGIYPKGSQGGLKMENLGEDTLTDAAGGRYQGLRWHFQWKNGLVVEDWRRNGRISNIDVSALTANAASGANLIQLMIKLLNRVKSAPKQVFYVNETIFTYLDLQTYNSSNMNVSYGKDAHGHPVMMFRGVPVKKCEAILDTETLTVVDA